jgi:hypothetical protein
MDNMFKINFIFVPELIFFEKYEYGIELVVR